MVCCGFGHRHIYEDINSRVDSAIINALEKGCSVFYTGAMGDFDNMFSSAVRKAKHIYPNIKLICIKPYMTADINTKKEYYNTFYDDVIIPKEIIGKHYKSAITARNKWMVDKSDIIIGYTVRNYGGAYTALMYASKTEKNLIVITSN